MSTIVTRSGKGVPLTATDHDNNVNNLNTDKVETLADLSITSTATEINLLDGVTATTAELNYVDGVTSNIQTQLGTKLPLAGGTMTGTIAGFTSTGIDDNATSTAITIDSSEKVSIGGSGSVSSDSQVAIKGGNLELATAGAKYWIPRASDGALTGSLYSPSGSVVRLSGALTSAGTIEFEPRSSNGVIARVTGDGLCFGSDTAAANALDDYEEGTWTPVIGGDSGTSGQTYSVQDGYYTKIGNTVTCNGRATLSAKGTLTGGIIITGLPFSSNGTTTYRNPGSVGYFGSLGASVVDLSINMAYGVSNITVYKLSAAGIVREALDTTDITNTTQIDIAITYKV